MSNDKKKNKKDNKDLPPPGKPKGPHKKEVAPTPDDNNPDAQYEDKDGS